jgi:hypothetical protein
VASNESFYMNVMAIRNVLRIGSSEDLDRRSKILCLSAIGLVDFSIISLYQTGVIKKLPDIPLPIFDSNKVNAAESAYQFGVPDGPYYHCTNAAKRNKEIAWLENEN